MDCPAKVTVIAAEFALWAAAFVQQIAIKAAKHAATVRNLPAFRNISIWFRLHERDICDKPGGGSPSKVVGISTSIGNYLPDDIV
jgi:hypothetical protein